MPHLHIEVLVLVQVLEECWEVSHVATSTLGSCGMVERAEEESAGEESAGRTQRSGLFL